MTFMDTMQPTFSIIMPVYNEEKYIRDAIDSILAQTETDWEAILVDDGSTDTTPTILDDYAIKDKRIRVFHKPNGGQSTAINKGVKEAKGEWLCWLSGDDYFHPQKLEYNKQWIQNFPGKNFFFSGHWLILPDGEKIEYNLDWLSLEHSEYHLISLFRCNYVMGISICIKRETWQVTGEFSEELRYAHDLDMWLRLMLVAQTKYLPDRTCTMRYHPGQETARFPLAPLFDSAKAGIRLLNEHSFVEFFPGIDISNRQIAADILNRTLDFVVCEPNSSLYALGCHPLLVLRILEWMFTSGLDPQVLASLRTVLLKHISEMVTLQNSTSFSLMWKGVRSALLLNTPCFHYNASQPSQIGTVNYYQQKRDESDKVEPLKKYLETYDRVSLQGSTVTNTRINELVIILPFEYSLDDYELKPRDFLIEILSSLIICGFPILLVGKSHPSLGMINGVTFIGADNREEINQLVSNLGYVETLVSVDDAEGLNWVKSGRKVHFILSGRESSAPETVLALLKKIDSAPFKQTTQSSKTRGFVWLRQKIRRKLKYWQNRLSIILSSRTNHHDR
jgi:glycosyltransferase involved in cell wall biosynthesis